MVSPLLGPCARVLGTLAALLPLFCISQPVLAQQTLAEAMAQAIARMMESMGFNLTQNAPPPPPAAPGGAWPWAQPFPSVPSVTWQPWQGGTGWTMTSVLEGVWEDNQGGLLIVQGGFYRLYGACRGYIDGDIRILGNRVELSNRREGFSQSFEFALDQGRLALRDQNGQIYVYRKLILNPALAPR